MVLLGLLGLLVVAIVLAAKSKKDKAATIESSARHYDPSLYNTDPKAVKIEPLASQKQIENPDLFPTLKIRHHQVVGMYYSYLPASLAGEFVGYAECEENSHDEHAVAIYHSSGQKIGYVPKGKKKLSDSIHTWHGGRSFCYGSLKYYPRSDNWSGTVYIPVGVGVKSMEEFRQYEKEESDLRTFLKKEDLSADDKLKALRWKQEIISKYIRAGSSSQTIFPFPRTLLPSLSMDLEREERWQDLANLLEFSDDIQLNLSDRYANTTMRRIEKAQEKIAQGNTGF